MMEWHIYVGIPFLLLIGYQIADILVMVRGLCQRRSSKIATGGAMVLLPILIFIAVWMYNSITICSHCRSVSTNSPISNLLSIDAQWCRKCFRHVGACKICAEYQKKKTTAPVDLPDKTAFAPQSDFDRDDSYHDDDGFDFAFAGFIVLACLFLINIGYFARLSVLGITWFVKRGNFKSKKKKSEENIDETGQN